MIFVIAGARCSQPIDRAAETESVVENARAKPQRKGADVIIANDVSPATGILGGEETELHIVLPDGHDHLPHQPKRQAAHALMHRFAALLRKKEAGGDA